jgi:hypothetical protein
MLFKSEVTGGSMGETVVGMMSEGFKDSSISTEKFLNLRWGRNGDQVCGTGRVLAS